MNDLTKFELWLFRASATIAMIGYLVSVHLGIIE